MYKIVFSATGRTQTVADIICSVFEDVKSADLSQVVFDNMALSENDLCVVAVPVYGGRVPAPAAANMAKISANGAKAVLVAVYGNRAYDDCMAELKALCVKSDFVPVAACAIVAQHSIFPQVAADRPDGNDKKELMEFGAKIKEMWTNSSLPADVAVPGNVSDKEPKAIPLHPKATTSCVKCGLCAAKCPVQAIPVDNPQQTDKNECITCMRCVEICPENSRVFAPGIAPVAGAILRKAWGKHLENEFFIG